MNGLRSFIDLDNRRAVEVGHLRQKPTAFQGQKKVSEHHSEVVKGRNG